MGIEAPPRAQYIRTILTELSRIATFLLFLGEMGLQVGAITPAFYGFRDREYVLNLIEAVTGGRFHPNFNRIGGLKDDLPWGWITECRTTMKQGPRRRATSSRTSSSATRSSSSAPARSASSRPSSARPTACRARTSARRASTGTSAATASRTSSYNELDWKVWTHPDGDSFARYWVRLQETRESARMVLQMLDADAEPARSWRRCRASSRCPRARSGSNTENPLGEMGYYVVSKGATGPFRVKIRSRVVQQRVDPAVDAARRVRPRHHHDPREPLLHPRGHRPVIALVDVDRARRRLGHDARDQDADRARRSCRSTALILGYIFLLKMMSHMQSRLGPMDPGGFHGWYQLVGDGIKFLQKEDIMPAEADRRVFALAPAVVVLSTFLVFVVIPAGPRLVVDDPRRRRVLRARGVEPLGHRRADGRAGRAPTSSRCIGALRAAAQLIAYELPLRARGRRRRDPGRHDEPAGHRARPAERLDLRLERHRLPVHPHAVRRLRPLHGRGAGRAHPAAVRHAGRRVASSSPATWSSTRASGSCSSSSASSAPRSRSRRSRPRCSSAAGRSRGSHGTRGRRARPARAVRQGDARRVLDVLGALHLPALARGPAPGARVEVADPDRARQHPRRPAS